MKTQVRTKLGEMLEKMLSGMHDPVAVIVQNEIDRGFKVIRPGDAPWFPAADWRAASVASIDGEKVRLVLIHAIESNRGAMTRLIEGITSAGLIPIVIDPIRELAATLKKRGWRGSARGSSTYETREIVWRQG